MIDAKDLAARLRDWSEGPGTDALCAEAADLIEQQQNNIDNMRLQLDEQAAEIEGYRNTYQGMRAHRILRLAVDAMMASLGYHGTISARDDRVQEVMDALAQIDMEEQE